jgi:hypothetical protein
MGINNKNVMHKIQCGQDVASQLTLIILSFSYWGRVWQRLLKLQK